MTENDYVNDMAEYSRMAGWVQTGTTSVARDPDINNDINSALYKYTDSDSTDTTAFRRGFPNFHPHQLPWPDI